MKNTTLILCVLFLLFLTTGFSCINDKFLVSVNIKGLTGEHNVNPGNPNFRDCKTYTARDYLDPDFTNIKDVRIYDVRVSTIGNYPGNLLAGSGVTANGTDILRMRTTQPWSYFHTPRSLLTDPNIQRVPAGFIQLVLAIKNKQDVVICGEGTLSGFTVPAGLKVKIEVLGQVDAEP